LATLNWPASRSRTGLDPAGERTRKLVPSSEAATSVARQSASAAVPVVTVATSAVRRAAPVGVVDVDHPQRRERPVNSRRLAWK
jgi:hypothetical protein